MGRRYRVALPNLLTYGRIAAVPAIVALMMLQADWAQWLALTVFVLASVTDFFDGYLARAWQQQSTLGRMLDPIADKLLVASVLLMLVADGTIGPTSLWAAIVILCREILVSGLREFLAELRVSVPVSALAKWKTLIQMIALGFLIAGDSAERLISVANEIGLTLLWIAALVTLYTGYDYFRAGLHHVIGDDE
ncbi:MAG: CDP-diacylglycerol--glycerol-3-phosphate 3-phosphatidyltransferase [Bauldia sp.]